MEEELVLVATDPAAREINDLEYVHVDWGPDFALRHEASFPDVTPGLSANLGPLALNYVLSVGGAGYFRMQAVKSHILAGRLHVMPGAPRFSYPVYVVHSANLDEEVLGPVLAGLRKLPAACGDT